MAEPGTFADGVLGDQKSVKGFRVAATDGDAKRLPDVPRPDIAAAGQTWEQTLNAFEREFALTALNRGGF